jgi:hypothetical protein
MTKPKRTSIYDKNKTVICVGDTVRKNGITFGKVYKSRVPGEYTVITASNHYGYGRKYTLDEDLGDLLEVDNGTITNN